MSAVVLIQQRLVHYNPRQADSAPAPIQGAFRNPTTLNETDFGVIMNKKLLFNSALGTLLLASTVASATGFVRLSNRGISIDGGGTSAYAVCNTTGDFGNNPNGSTPPTFEPFGGENNTCALPTATPPLEGFRRVANARRDMIMNNVYTLRQPVKVGTVIDRVWRKGAECIYGAKIRLDNVDYDLRPAEPGRQYFEVNDFLRGGFRGKGPISIAYVHTTEGPAASDEVLYRAGLTLTSVVNFPGDPAQPPVSVAPINSNWVAFTSDINFRDDDGSSFRDSPWFLVRSACTATAAPVPRDNALRFRQMGQEDQPLLEIRLRGFAP